MTEFRRRLNHIKTDSQRTGGFTLVELIVVLVVLAILCTGAVMGIIGWQDHADFKKQNQYAQNIFVAAQTQLTQYGERGQLTNLKDLVTDSGKADPKEYLLAAQGVLTDSTGNAFSASDDNVWQTDESTEKTPHKGDIYFLKVKKGDYQIYRDELKGLSSAQMKQRTLEERRIRALFDMLDPYIADKSTFDAAICVEFSPDPKVGLVYSVFYNEKVNEFTYAEKTETDTKTVSIRDRRESARKEDKIGYYGAEVLSRGTDTYIARPVISNVRLSNRDVLSLSWSINNIEALTKLIYTIKIVPEGMGVDRTAATLSFGRSDRELKPDSNGLVPGNFAKPQPGAAEGEPWVETELDFPMTIDLSTKTITLTLDGLDLGADEGADAATLKESASISRLELDNVENFYVFISGDLPGTYRLTTEKQSNSEHQYFGKYQKKPDGGQPDAVYTIENARHFNNIRYFEKKKAAVTGAITYRMTTDLDWKETLKKETIYEDAVKISADSGEGTATLPFKPILNLRKESALVTEETDKPYKLINFVLDSEHIPNSDGYPVTGIPKDTLGLFVQNQGLISNLLLEQITVKGKPEGGQGATGAFCGENEGSLKSLTVQSGSITGDVNVGGIVGAVRDSGTYEKLVNRADVTGRMYIGGIAGSIITDQGSVMISECYNYGKIKGDPLKGDSYYIGGIAGYSKAGAGATVTLSKCGSSPSYTDDEIQTLLEEIKKGDIHSLVGTYVGGIVGFNHDTLITECNTLREQPKSQGYVIGKDYVGGIVGFNAGNAGSSLSGSGNRNQAHVIGSSYVGGITGCNAEGILDANTHQITIQKPGIGNNAVISSWVNEGVVLAANNYVGGITGFNYGTIQDCSSNVDYTGAAQNLTEVSSNANYAGGIAGYNGGVIESSGTATISAVSVISGKDYVGGIVGYNDIGGVIRNYELKGGYIHGKRFVGGFIGLNASESVFGNAIVCNLNEVSGDYFVGGIMGGNLLPASGDQIEATFLTDNFLGSLKAEQGAFAGGFIGYNYLLDGTRSKEELRTAIQTNADALCAQMNPIETGTESVSDQLEKPLEGFLSSYANSIGTTMVIRGVEQTATQAKLEGITALVYAGGVIGYNQNSTHLTIQNVENITPVTATAYITRTEAGIPGEKQYSYAGGIIGKVSENVTLDNCRNLDVGEVVTRGTYTGGLSEINYGLIRNCTAGSLGSGDKDYVGGLVGANAASEDGKGLENCIASGTIMGQSYVGGLAAENFGRIYNPGISQCIMVATGEHVGGVVGYGYRGSRIEWQSDSELELDISIEGSASNVGGVVGTNAGTIQSNTGNNDVTNIGSSITGQQNIGGFIGVQTEAPENGMTIQRLKNQADVQAEEGYAGGIVAKILFDADTVRLMQCENFGVVEVLSGDGGDMEDEDAAPSAGGITAVNYGRIESCANYAEVKASNGYSGGITALNYGKILRSLVSGRLDNVLELSGDRYVGGVAAKNKKNAIIQDSAVRSLVLQNQSGSEHGYIGGIVAENEGTIEHCTVGVEWEPQDNEKSEYATWQSDAALAMFDSIKRAGSNAGDGSYTLEKGGVVLTSNAVDAAMGGVAGINTGDIQGETGDEYSVVLAELKFAERSMNYYGYMGGIAGINRGEIRKYEFSGLIHGTANNPSNTPEFNPNSDFEVNGSTIYGYGGIAGINGSDRKSDDAVITDCGVIMAKIHGIGDANNRVNVGGVAGVNGVDAKINQIWYGDMDDLKLNTAGATGFFMYPISGSGTFEGSVRVGTDTYGHAGGVAGYNQGMISDVNIWDSYFEKREQYFVDGKYPSKDKMPGAPMEKTGVLVVNETGHGGGIVGFNRQTGSIKEAVTGNRWLVYAPKQGEDNAVGGIIGYNISEQNLEFCDNHGTVVKKVGNSVGGVVGRNENATTSAWRFYECRNYGKIDAAARTGGMVGHWKYKGGTLERCQNYGSIEATGGEAGGMAGLLYSMGTGETINLIDCRNHGNIKSTGGPCAGMVANIDKNKSNIILNLSGCINTGLIGREDRDVNSAGMVANSNNATMNLAYCQNYGYGPRTLNYSGLCTKIDNATMVHCFGLTDPSIISKPISKGSQKKGYYFKKGSISTAGIPLTITGTSPPYQAKNGNTTVLPNIGDHSLEKIFITENGTDEDNRTTDSSLAYRLYLSLHGFLNRQQISSLPAPTIKDGKNQDGFFQIEWGKVTNAQYYEIECTYYDDQDRQIGETQSYTSYTEQLKLNAAFSAGGVYASKVKAKVRAYAIKLDGDVLFSTYSPEKTFNMSILLPVPQIHWELVHLDKDACYRVVLDNKAEFEQFVTNQNRGLELKDIQITTSLGSRDPITFPASDTVEEREKYLQKGNGTGNVQSISYASLNDEATEEVKSKYAQSSKVIRETRLPDRGNYTGGRMALSTLEKTDNTPKNGFSGSVIDALSYQTTLQITNDWVFYHRVEMVAKDPVMKVPVAYAISAQNRTSSTSKDPFQVPLTGFPADFLDREGNGYRYQDVMVRCYPTKSSNDIGYCGWQVQLPKGTNTLSSEDLKELKVNTTGRLDSSGDLLISEDKLQVQDGYVIEYVGPDQYTLYYNTLLREVDGFQTIPELAYTHNSQKTTYMKNQVIYRKLDLKNEIQNVQPKPVIYANAQYTADPSDASKGIWQNGDYNAADLFTLTWDQDTQGTNPAYSGEDGSAPYDKAAEYRLTVTGKLAEEGSKETTLVNNKTIKTSDLENGRYNFYEADASRWEYTNIHVSLTRVGITNSSGNTEKFPSITEADFPMLRRLSRIGKPTIALQKDEQGVTLKDGLNYQISWMGLTRPEELAILEAYEVKITGADSKLVKVFQTPVDNPSQTSLQVNLEEFRRGEKITVNVKAVAQKGNGIYRNGIDGTEREMTLPSRLLAPEMDGRMTQESLPVLSVDEFQQGCMTIAMQPDNYAADKNVKYQIALQIFDSMADAEADTDGSLAFQVEELPGKDSAVYMDKGTTNHIYKVQGVPAQYAGKYLKVVLRAVSSSDISSVWTDEDVDIPGEEDQEDYTKVTPYQIFQLPTVQLDTVEMSEYTTEWEIESPVYADGEIDETNYPDPVKISQEAFTFLTAKYVNDYQIVMIQTPQKAGSSSGDESTNVPMLVSDVVEMMLHKTSEDTYQITCQSTEAAYQEKNTADPIVIKVDGDMVKLPYEKEILLSTAPTPGDKTLTLKASAYLQAETVEDGIQFTMILPDFKELRDSSFTMSAAYTEQILIQSMVSEGMGDYAASDWAMMARASENDPLERITAITMNTDAQSPQPNAQAMVSSRPGVAFETALVTASGTDSRYLVSIEQDGKELGVLAVPFIKSGVNYASTVWLPDWFASYAESSVTLTFRNVFDVGSQKQGGLSLWAKEKTSVLLPELPLSESVVLTQMLSESRTYQIAGSSRLKTGGSGQLTVRQSQVDWIYDLTEDSKISGYDITIQGLYGEPDYHLQLNLQQNRFGEFPGLREYLREGGKTLYAVAFGLDGDVVRKEPVVTASPSDAEENGQMATPSNQWIPLASDSNVASGTLLLHCTLKAELMGEEDEATALRFTLTLPDVAVGQWKGTQAETYLQIYPDGMYDTECIRIESQMVNRYYEAPEEVWCYLEKSLMERLEEGEIPEFDSADTTLINDLES